MKSKFLEAILVLMFFVLTACGASGATASLVSASWQLVSIAGKAPVVNTSPSIAFEDGQVSGNSSCNSYGGEYTIKGDTIQFGMLMSTMMACADHAAMNQERDFMVFLRSVERWELRDGQLFLFRPDGETLVFEMQK